MADKFTRGRTLRDIKHEQVSFVDFYAKEAESFVGRNNMKRERALSIDAMPVAFVMVMLVMMAKNYASANGQELLLLDPSKSPVENAGIQFIRMLPFFIVLICKDIFGRSLGKRIYKLKIVSTDNCEQIPKWKLFVRNLTLFIWPIDALVLKFSGRRMLDKLLKLDVIEE